MVLILKVLFYPLRQEVGALSYESHFILTLLLAFLHICIMPFTKEFSYRKVNEFFIVITLFMNTVCLAVYLLFSLEGSNNKQARIYERIRKRNKIRK
jgi:NADH:ubiquinone oxidoreductase subunit H